MGILSPYRSRRGPTKHSLGLPMYVLETPFVLRKSSFFGRLIENPLTVSLILILLWMHDRSKSKIHLVEIERFLLMPGPAGRGLLFLRHPGFEYLNYVKHQWYVGLIASFATNAHRLSCSRDRVAREDDDHAGGHLGRW